MDTIVIVFLLAIIALIIMYFLYDKYKKEKKVKDPSVYIDGLKALLDGRVEAAFGKFREVVSEDSANIDAYIRIGDILRKYGKADKALQVHKDLTMRHGLTAAEKILILRSLALDFIELKDYQSAEASVEELLSLNSKNRWANEKLLEIHSLNQDWIAALEVKEKLVKLDGDKSKSPLAIYKFLQGEKLFRKKDYHKARLLFKEAISMKKSCVPAYVYIGDSYLAENRLEDAVSYWQNMIRIVPDEAHLVLGRLQKALFSLGKFGEISAVCIDILDSSPKNMAARLTLAEYHYKKGEASAAIEHLDVAVDENPDSLLPVLSLARMYLSAGQTDRLADLLERIEEKEEKQEQAYICGRCGFKSESKIWLCPNCKAVDSFEK